MPLNRHNESHLSHTGGMLPAARDKRPLAARVFSSFLKSSVIVHTLHRGSRSQSPVEARGYPDIWSHPNKESCIATLSTVEL